MAKTNNNVKVYINADGEEVLRITSVIKMLAKDALIMWANMLGFKRVRYYDELNRAANIGTMVHHYLEDLNTEGVLAMEDFEGHGIYNYRDRVEAQNAIESFSKWYRKYSKIYKPAFTEKVVVGKQVGGTIDLGLKGIKDPNKIIICDYKTSGGLYLTMYLQLAGYIKLYEEVYGPDTVEGCCIFLLNKKQGDMAKAAFIPRKKMNIYIEAFENLLKTTLGVNIAEGMYKDDIVELGHWSEK